MKDFLKDEELFETAFFSRNAIQQVIDFENCRHPESDPVPGVFEHFFDGGKLLFLDEVSVKQVCREMNGYLPYILGSAISLLPDVLDVFSDERQFIVRDFLTAVSDNSAYSLPVLDEVEFYGFVAVLRVGELSFVALYYPKAVLCGKLRLDGYYFRHPILVCNKFQFY